MPANLADAMIRLLDGSSNEGLATLSQIPRQGQHMLGQLWTSQLSPQATEDLRAPNTVLPGLRAQFEAAQPHAQRHSSTFVDAELLAGTTVNFPRSLARLAWILQHAATLLPMAGDIQAVFKVSDRRSERHPCLGVDAPFQFKSQSCTNHKITMDGPLGRVQEATKLNAETRDPPSQDPRDHKEQPSRHDIHPDTLKQSRVATKVVRKTTAVKQKSET